jgi:hypothetical protein
MLSNNKLLGKSGEIYLEHTIVSVELIDGKLEVVKRFPSNLAYASNPLRLVPDQVVKEVYESVEGEIKLTRSIAGQVNPQKIIPESIEFPQ